MSEKFPTTKTVVQGTLPFEMEHLPEFYQKKAAAELNETPENKKDKFKKLKKLLNEDKDSKGLIFIDELLVQFLRVRKHDAEMAFRQIKSYITLRKKNPNMYLDLKFDTIVQTIEDESLYVLPWRCEDGCTILVIEVDNWDSDTFSVEEVKRAMLTYFMGSLRYPMTQVNGIKLIFDVKSNLTKHLRHCTPNNLHLIYHGAQNVCPSRFKEIHVINDSILFRTAYAIIKLFLSEKIQNRIIFHKDPQTLLNYFPRSILPKHFGGDLENYAMTNWLKRTLEPENLVNIGGVRNWPSKK